MTSNGSVAADLQPRSAALGSGILFAKAAADDACFLGAVRWRHKRYASDRESVQTFGLTVHE